MSHESRNEFIDDHVTSELGGLIHKYYDKYFADDSLTDLEVLVLSLHLIDRRRGKVGAQYSELKQLFCELGRSESNFPMVLKRARESKAILERDKVIFLSVTGLKRLWKIMGRGLKSKVFVLKSGQEFSAVKLIENFLMSEMNGEEILLCDPYVSPVTLYPFSTLKGRLKSLKLLTSNIYEQEKFNKYANNFQKETKIKVEVRTSKKIHDRYLICGEKCWAIGSSLKDLGNKDTIIKEISEVANSLIDLFSERWKEAIPHNL